MNGCMMRFIHPQHQARSRRSRARERRGARAGLSRDAVRRRQGLLLAEQAADQHPHRDGYHEPHEANQHHSAHVDFLFSFQVCLRCAVSIIIVYIYR